MQLGIHQWLNTLINIAPLWFYHHAEVIPLNTYYFWEHFILKYKTRYLYMCLRSRLCWKSQKYLMAYFTCSESHPQEFYSAALKSVIESWYRLWQLYENEMKTNLHLHLCFNADSVANVVTDSWNLIYNYFIENHVTPKDPGLKWYSIIREEIHRIRINVSYSYGDYRSYLTDPSKKVAS